MARYSTTVESDLSVDDAFAYMADLRNFAEWDPGVSEAELIRADGPGPDAVYRVTANGIELEYETREFQPPTQVFVVAESTFFESADRVTVEPHAGGSRVTYEAELRLPGPLRLFDPVLSIVFNRIGDKAAAGLEKAIGAERVS